jgi:Secretion system C-terminal sorting domain
MKKLLHYFSLFLFTLCCKFLYSQEPPPPPIYATFGTTVTHNKSYFGLNGANVWEDDAGYNAVDNLLLPIKVKHVRHIGGAYSEFFNWQTGLPLLTGELLYGYNRPSRYGLNGTANTIDLFKDVIQSEGAEMMFVLNNFTTKFNHQRAGIMYANLIGQKIKGVEFGNEFANDGFAGHQEFANLFPTPEVYADSVNGWVKTLKHTFGIYTPKMAAVGTDFAANNENNIGEEDRIKTWLPRMLNKINWVGTEKPDAVIIHRYLGSGYTGGASLTTNIAAMDAFLNTPQKNFAKLNAPGSELDLVNQKNAKVWLSEYGMFDKGKEVHGTWGHGLFSALLTLKFLESEVIELADIHSMLGSSLFSCFFSDNDGFNLPSTFNDNWNETGNDPSEGDDDTGLNGINYSSIEGEKTAVGNAISLVSKAMDNATSRQKMTFINCPQTTVTYSDGEIVNYPKLYGWKFTTCGGAKSYVIINASSSTINLQESTTEIYGYATTLTANPREYIRGNAINTLTDPVIDLTNINPDHVPYELTTILDGTGFYAIKPYSITTIRRKSVVLCPTIINSCDVAAAQVAQGNTFTIKVDGVGPFKWTSNVSFITKNNLIVPLDSTTVGDNIKLTAYKPNGNTPYNVIFTVKDLGNNGITADVTLVVKSLLNIDILQGTTSVTNVAATCSTGCVTLSASNIDGTTADNRYEWYPILDGSVTSTTGYGKNGYSQTVTICPKKPSQVYTVIAYSGVCDYAIKSVTVNTVIANANPLLNDEKEVYVCNSSQGGGNIATLGTPALIAVPAYTYNWTTNGGIINPGQANLAQPQVTGPGGYTVSVSNGTCTKTSSVLVKAYQCCYSPNPADKVFYPYTKMQAVIDAIPPFYLSTSPDGTIIVSNFADKLIFNGPIIMDETGATPDPSVTFSKCDNMKFSEYAKLMVRDGKTLTINDNSVLDQCASKMWKGITAQTAQEEVIVLSGSKIRNAYYALEGNNNALVSINSSIFDRNLMHLRFNNYGGNATGITSNIFKHTGGNLLAPYTTRTRTDYGIYFNGGLGSIQVGGAGMAAQNTFDNCLYGVFANGSGLNVTKNLFTNFEQGVRGLDAKKDLLYIIEGNDFSSNYSFLNTDVELNNKGTAVYMVANANITPYALSVKGNTIKYSRQGIFMSKFNGLPLITDLAGEFGGEIKENNITLYKDPDAADDFTHRAIVLMDNSSIDVVKNTIKTDPTTFGSLSPQTKIDKYFGIEGKNQGGGCDYFDNQFTQLGQMIVLSGNNELAQLKCNKFIRGTTVNYPGDGSTSGITAIQLKDAVAMSPQGTAVNTSNNTWQNFGPSYFRARWSNQGSSPAILYNYNTIDIPAHNPNSPDVFFADDQTVNYVCNSFPGMVINQNDGNNHQNNDLSKDGGDEIDSLTIVNYEPTYDSTSVINDLYGDVTELQLTFDAIAAGLVDSATVIEIYAESAALGIYNLEQAISNGDSTAIIASFTYLPKDIVGDNYKTIAFVNAKSTEWTNLDSLDLHYVAYQRVDEGGPAVVSARNMLGIYVDESTIAPKSNQRRKNLTGGAILNIVPNPNNGSFIVNTNLPDKSKILIHNTLGQLIHECQVTGVSTKIELNSLYSGIYSLSVIDLSGKSWTTSFAIGK